MPFIVEDDGCSEEVIFVVPVKRFSVNMSGREGGNAVPSSSKYLLMMFSFKYYTIFKYLIKNVCSMYSVYFAYLYTRGEVK